MGNAAHECYSNPGHSAIAEKVLSAFSKMMATTRYVRFFLLLILALFLTAAPILLQGQTDSAAGPLTQLNRITSFSALPNGIDVRDGDARMQIVALRENVVRIRVAPSSELAEDASWAVLKEARQSAVAVTPDNTPDAVGFHTQTLTVSIIRQTFALTISDRNGTVLQKDVRPIEFHGKSFSVYKSMPIDEHYFGLGDKPGPLDRRGQAFTMWNTDAYAFQESTDPIYKSIPYFMAFRSGRAIGVFLDNTWRTSFDFGKQSPDTYSFGSVSGPLDYYIFYGPIPKQVVETYAWLTGTTPLPPIWALGFQQSRYSYTPQARVLEVANRFRTDHIPADVIYLDIDYQERNRPFTCFQELSRGRDYRSARRKISRTRLCALRQRPCWRSLRQESRRQHLLRRRVAGPQRLSRLHARADSRVVGRPLSRIFEAGRCRLLE